MLVQVGMKAMSKKPTKKKKSFTKSEGQTEVEEAYYGSGVAAAETDQGQDAGTNAAFSSDAQSESLKSILENLNPRQLTALTVASRWVLGQDGAAFNHDRYATLHRLVL
jgi:hypothetical protein